MGRLTLYPTCGKLMESKYKIVITKAFRKNLDRYIRKGKESTKLNEGVLKMTIPDKPTSRNQRYVRAENEEKD